MDDKDEALLKLPAEFKEEDSDDSSKQLSTDSSLEFESVVDTSESGTVTETESTPPPMGCHDDDSSFEHGERCTVLSGDALERYRLFKKLFERPPSSLSPIPEATYMSSSVTSPKFSSPSHVSPLKIVPEDKRRQVSCKLVIRDLSRDKDISHLPGKSQSSKNGKKDSMTKQSTSLLSSFKHGCYSGVTQMKDAAVSTVSESLPSSPNRMPLSESYVGSEDFSLSTSKGTAPPFCCSVHHELPQVNLEKNLHALRIQGSLPSSGSESETGVLENEDENPVYKEEASEKED